MAIYAEELNLREQRLADKRFGGDRGEYEED